MEERRPWSRSVGFDGSGRCARRTAWSSPFVFVDSVAPFCPVPSLLSVGSARYAAPQTAENESGPWRTSLLGRSLAPRSAGQIKAATRRNQRRTSDHLLEQGLQHPERPALRIRRVLAPEEHHDRRDRHGHRHLDQPLRATRRRPIDRQADR